MRPSAQVSQPLRISGHQLSPFGETLAVKTKAIIFLGHDSLARFGREREQGRRVALLIRKKTRKENPLEPRPIAPNRTEKETPRNIFFKTERFQVS